MVRFTGMTEETALRAQGLTELEILDLVHAVAMFSWAERLKQSLGEAVLG
jgi:alkylhydroperoxidase family enzyme